MIEKTIVGPQSHIEIIKEDNTKLVKKIATEQGKQDLIDQVHLYTNLPRRLAKHFPILLDTETTNKPFYYVMPYYNLPTLRWFVMHSQYSPEEIILMLKPVIEFLFGKYYRWKTEKASDTYIKHYYIERAINRLLKMSKETALFREILSLDEFCFENQIIKNPLKILTQIQEKESLIQELSPKNLYSVHGQLGLSHILLNEKNNNRKKFILIDAKNTRQLLDIAYDIGKLYRCLHLLTEWLEEDYFSINFLQIKNKFLVTNLSFGLATRVNASKKIAEWLKKEILQNKNMLDLQVSNLNIDFAEAIDTCASVPFSYRSGDVERAVASYVLGAKSLQSFWNIYK